MSRMIAFLFTYSSHTDLFHVNTHALRPVFTIVLGICTRSHCSKPIYTDFQLWVPHTAGIMWVLMPYTELGMDQVSVYHYRGVESDSCSTAIFFAERELAI